MLIALGGQSSCYYYEDTLPFERAAYEIATEQYYDIYHSGKRKGAPILKELYTPGVSSIPCLFQILDKETLLALGNQLELLEYRPFRRKWAKGGLKATNGDLKKVLEILLDNRTNPAKIKEQLVAYRIWGSDRKGHVKFTGYYTPTMEVKHEPDSIFRYPFYRYPSGWAGPLPTRKQIDGEGALDSLGLEIAYAANPVDVYYTHLQGSGLLEFVDTDEKFRLTYGGSNRQPYKSIESHLVREAGVWNG